jgi:TPR repeat protein
MRLGLATALICLCVLFADSAFADDAQVQPPADPAPQTQPSNDKLASDPAPAARKNPDGTSPDWPFVQGDQKRFDEGLAAYDAHKYKRAFKIFSELADKEDIAAMRNVAFMKRKGLGTDKDPEAALDLYEYVARAGLPTAQYDLADMLLNGEAGDPDPKRAVAWLELAARASHPLAQYRLGVLYEEGIVVPKDLFKAKLLYSAAAQHGSKDALARLSALKGWPKPYRPAPPGLQPLDSGPPKQHG